MTATLSVHGSSSGWQATASFDSAAAAEAFAASFPKSAGLKIHGANATSRAILRGDAVNGGVNETGVRRYQSLIAHAQQLGITIEWHDHATTRIILIPQDEFETAVFGSERIQVT
ncbi:MULTISPECIES: hypothetical protein [Mycolicibacter]|uniref:Uncharacterized protein n=2 Tax=Mycolicibacter TaxID=1073531 RepID=A0ABU5XMM5_9MYCO|nr:MULTISPECIES: hypothetical protein [unclassified Mycolicibacter]MEB3023007.1 hypothetical protein [Mycolicibacter sp. MYC098]MEB3033516.1 hypothetical protein [Mycolicibacter sp. MYC340]